MAPQQGPPGNLTWGQQQGNQQAAQWQQTQDTWQQGGTWFFEPAAPEPTNHRARHDSDSDSAETRHVAAKENRKKSKISRAKTVLRSHDPDYKTYEDKKIKAAKWEETSQQAQALQIALSESFNVMTKNFVTTVGSTLHPATMAAIPVPVTPPTTARGFQSPTPGSSSSGLSPGVLPTGPLSPGAQLPFATGFPPPPPQTERFTMMSLRFLELAMAAPNGTPADLRGGPGPVVDIETVIATLGDKLKAAQNKALSQKFFTRYRDPAAGLSIPNNLKERATLMVDICRRM